MLKAKDIRSILDLKDFNDDEVNTEKSMTDPEQDEPIGALVARMMRGEQVSFREASYDKLDGLSVDQAFASIPEVSRPGFDIADSQAIVEAAQKAQADLDAAKAAELAAKSAPPPVPAPLPATPPVIPPVANT